jgi:hypothetical protein
VATNKAATTKVIKKMRMSSLLTRSSITLAFSCGARSAFRPKEQGYLRNMLSRRQLQGFVIPLHIVSGFSFLSPERRSAALFKSFKSKVPSRLRAARATKLSSLALLYWFSNSGTRDNVGLQLRRAISIQAKEKKAT